MAEIDARIPLMAQQAKIPDLTEMYGNAANMANLMQQTQLNRLNYQGTIALNQALQDQSNIDPNTGAPDVGKVLGGVAGQGYGAAPAVLAYGKNATDIAKTRAETGKFTADTQKALADTRLAALDGHTKAVTLAGQLVAGITDENSYQNTLRMLAKADPQMIADAPASFSDGGQAWAQQKANEAVTAVDRMKNQTEMYKAISGRMEAGAAQSQAGTAAGRLAVDTLAKQHEQVATPTGVFSFNALTGAPSGVSAPTAPGGTPQAAIPINPQAVESLKTSGKNYADQLADYQKEAVQTGTDLNQLKQLQSLSKGADLGPGAHGIGALRNLAGTYLGDTDTSRMTANAQIDQIASTLVTKARNNPDTRLTGASTQAQLALEQAGQVERKDPRAAFEAKVQALIDLRQRMSEVSNAAVNYADKNNGVLDNKFFQQAAQATRAPLYSGQQRPPLSSYHTGGQ